MDYSIAFVEDADMPEGHDFVMVEVDGDFAIFYRRSAISPRVLEDSWAAYRALCEKPRPRHLLTA